MPDRRENKVKSGERSISRRLCLAQRNKRHKKLFVVPLFFFWLYFFCFLILYPDESVLQTVYPSDQQGLSHSEFTHLALGSLMQDIQKGGPPGSQADFCRVCRCALSTPRMTAACARSLIADISVDLSGTAGREKGQRGGVLIPPDQPNALRHCRLDKVGGETSSTTGFWGKTENHILQSISGQVKRMRQMSDRYSLKYPPLPKLREAATAADERNGFIPGEAFCDVTSQLELNGRPYFGDAENVTSDIQVLSTTYLFLHMPNVEAWDARLLSIMYGSTLTYLIFDHGYLPLMNRKYPLLPSFIVKLKEIIKKNCKVKKLKNIYFKERISKNEFQVICIKCSITQSLEWSEVKKKTRWYIINAEDGQFISHNYAKRQPLLCENFRHSLVLSEVIKYGTKTAVFMGIWKEKDVIVKLFHPYHYFNFVGFRQFMENSRQRSPLIHYPSFSCYSSTYEVIFQVQPFLDGFQTLDSFIMSAKKLKTLPLVKRVEIAIQIVCVFYFFHEQNPAGFFVYDDNHPSQYLIKESTDGSYVVRVVDIDTLQLGHVDKTGGAKAKKFSSYPYGNIMTRCRCFYCNGRSNCQFFNTPESYEACGQLRESKAWNNEVPKLVDPGRHCSGSSDAWFEAQLLYYIFSGKIAWSSKGRKPLLQDIQEKRAPFVVEKKGKEKIWKSIQKLISQMFFNRSREETVLTSLLAICSQLGCLQTSCPAVYSTSDEFYSSPLFLPLD